MAKTEKTATEIVMSPFSFEQLSCEFSNLEAMDIVQSVVDMFSDYNFALLSVANGYGLTERDKNENPAEVLAELRDNLVLTQEKCNYFAYTLRCLTATLSAADRLLKEYQRAKETAGTQTVTTTAIIRRA